MDSGQEKGDRSREESSAKLSQAHDGAAVMMSCQWLSRALEPLPMYSVRTSPLVVVCLVVRPEYTPRGDPMYGRPAGPYLAFLCKYSIVSDSQLCIRMRSAIVYWFSLRFWHVCTPQAGPMQGT